MRLYVLPISTRRALLYCEPVSNTPTSSGTSYLDKIINKTNVTWAGWEKDTKSFYNWKKKTTEYGNLLFRRIPHEEWGLKTIPPMGKKQDEIGRMASNGSGSSPVGGEKALREQKVDVRFPGLYQDLCKHGILDQLKRLATERQGLHRQRLLYSIVGMPLTIPFALIPVIPNLPFFYLVFRAYSHWKALRGSQHLEHLIKANVLRLRPSETLDSLYSTGLLYPNRDAARKVADPTIEQSRQVVQLLRAQTMGDTPPPKDAGEKTLHMNHPARPATNAQHAGKSAKPEQGEEEVMLLHGWNGKLIAERLKLPSLEVEIERAVEQVEKAIGKEESEMRGEKQELEALMTKSKPPAATEKATTK